MAPAPAADLTLWPSHAALWGVLRQEASGSGASLALRHEVLGDFITRLARRTPEGVGAVDPSACLMALREVVRKLQPDLRALPVHDTAFVDHAMASIHAAREAMVSPLDLLRAAGLMEEHRKGPLLALARLYGAYESHKEARGLWDGADALNAATAVLELGPPHLPATVHIRGLVEHVRHDGGGPGARNARAEVCAACRRGAPDQTRVPGDPASCGRASHAAWPGAWHCAAHR